MLCGRDWFNGCVLALDNAACIDWHVAEGQLMPPDTLVCHIEAEARALLSAERPALNFLQLLSGTATITRRHVDAMAGSGPLSLRQKNYFYF